MLNVNILMNVFSKYGLNDEIDTIIKELTTNDGVNGEIDKIETDNYIIELC